MEIKGDFLSFKFNGHDISEFGAVRVADGDRYSENLQPEIRDISVEVPGGDGEYYFGSTYGKQTFSVSIAFDSMTEADMRELRRVFACQKTGDLIFSERPYKKYSAKIESPIELSYVCFDEPQYVWTKIPIPDTEPPEYQQGISGDFEYKEYTGKVERIYKGEGKIDFVCYYPFAKSCYKEIPAPVSEDNKDAAYINNQDEWKDMCGILTSGDYSGKDTFEQKGEGSFEANLYNGGDIETGLRIYCPFGNNTHLNGLELVYKQGDDIRSLKLKRIDRLQKDNEDDDGFIIDTNSGLIIGVQNYNDTDGNITYTITNLYNQFVDSGYFFKIPCGEGTLTAIGGNSNMKIFYDYLYF